MVLNININNNIRAGTNKRENMGKKITKRRNTNREKAKESISKVILSLYTDGSKIEISRNTKYKKKSRATSPDNTIK